MIQTTQVGRRVAYPPVGTLKKADDDSLGGVVRGAASTLELLPDNRERLHRIRPYSNDAAALRYDGQRIVQDFWRALARQRHG